MNKLKEYTQEYSGYKPRLNRYNGFSSNKEEKLFKNLRNNKIEDEKVKWFDTDEAANYLRITPNALRILVHRARVKSYKLGNRLRFKQCDLASVLQPKEDY
jgi:excisionase family DNA binding protein